MRWTKEKVRLLKKLMLKGGLTAQDFQEQYADPKYARVAMSNFVTLGIAEVSDVGAIRCRYGSEMEDAVNGAKDADVALIWGQRSGRKDPWFDPFARWGGP